MFSPWISPVWVRTSLCESCLKLIHVVFRPGIDPWDDSCDCSAMGTCYSQELQVHSIPMNFACMNYNFPVQKFQVYGLTMKFLTMKFFRVAFQFSGELGIAIHRTCRFIVSPWISPAWIRTFLYKSFKLMVLPWISWPWNSFVWHFNFLGSLALPFTEFAGSWCPHEFLLRELELFCTKV